MLPHMGEEPMPLDMLSTSSLLYREADLVSALLRSIHLARNEYRIRVGFNHSLKLLGIDPASVVMCIVPISSEKKDALAHLQMMLIEAYCNENGIRLLHVLSPDELSNIVKPAAETDNEDDDMDEDYEYSDRSLELVVIQTAQNEHVEDDELQKIYDMACLHYNARPVIRLPS